MLNIYSNAIKFTDREGSIKIVVEKVLKGSEALNPFLKQNDSMSDLEMNISNEDYIIVSVTDSGVGIKLKDQDKLFKLFGSIKDEKLKINT